MLDNLNQIKKLDPGRIAESIELLPAQIKQVLAETRRIKIPRQYRKVNQVVVNGMGASNLGAGIIKSVFTDQLKIPLSIIPGYGVQANVDKSTLYIISSYSGSTEEPLSVYQKVKKRKAKILAITSNGKLEKLMKKNKIPGIVFKPKHNPSNQPRLGLGYSIFSTVLLLTKAKILKINLGEIKKVITNLEISNRGLTPNIKTKNNQAKKIAKEIFKKQPIIIGAEFLTGNLRVLRNQFCENSKNFSSYLILPELNHYALESLANPISNKKNLIFLFFDSKLYHPRIIKRSQLTKQVIKKNKIKIANYNLKGKTKLEQSLEMLQLGSWISFYLAILNKANPSEIPWVDWFKKQLKK